MGMDYEATLEEHTVQLIHIEEDLFVASLYQHIERDRQKSLHDHHIKEKSFHLGDLVLLHDNKFMKHLGKLYIHWLGPYLVNSIT